jgi:hypothetical protein
VVVSAVVLIRCDGTPADRPTMTLERCRAYLPTRADPVGPEGVPVAAARDEASRVGYAHDPATGRDLCPACARSHRRCKSCGGPLGGARCPMCDPRPNSADRAAGCVCPDGKPVPMRYDDWQPVAGCPVHTRATS